MKPWHMTRLLLAVRAWLVRLMRRGDVSSTWLRQHDSQDWTRGYEGVSCKWDEGARWKA
jgi:hypothetical protein